MGIKNGYSVIHLCTDSIGYLLPFLGEDHELYRLPLTVVDIVEHEILDDHRTETEHHHISTFQHCSELRDEHTGADDDEINNHQNGTQREVIILVYRSCHDITTARGTIVQEHDT